MEGAFSSNVGGKVNGGVRIWADEPPAGFVATYRETIEAAGFKVGMANESPAGWFLQAVDDAGHTVVLQVNAGATVEGTLNYMESR